MANVLIAGCGYVGAALAHSLMPAHRVWGLRRRADQLPTGVVPLALDMSQPFVLPDGLAFDWVFYTAAAAEFTPAGFQSAYVDGPRHLVAALAASGQQPKRVFYTSSTGVYGQRNGESVDETTPAEPGDATGRAVLQGEHTFLSCGLPSTVVRYAGIYGPGRASLLHDLAAGRAGVSDAPMIANLIHRDDCVGVLRFLLQQAENGPVPPVVVACDPHPSDRNELIVWLAGRMGLDAAKLPVRPLPPMARGRKRCDSTWLQHAGYGFQYPSFREGYESLLETEDWQHDH
jgi:nucleoside-diphosphate-sugar epimerase